MQLGVQKYGGTMYVCLFLYVYMYLLALQHSATSNETERQSDI